jgi:hypothetical protein
VLKIRQGSSLLVRAVRGILGSRVLLLLSPEATTPLKGNDGRKCKGGGVLKEYKKVVKPPEQEDANGKQLVVYDPKLGAHEQDGNGTSAKKRKTPTNSQNSAKAAMQRCPSQ